MMYKQVGTSKLARFMFLGLNKSNVNRSSLVVLMAIFTVACSPPTDVFNLETGFQFSGNSGTVIVQKLTNTTSVCYTTDGTTPVWSGGTCDGGSTQRIQGPVTAGEILLACGDETGPSVLRTVQITYDWEDTIGNIASADYYLNCGADTPTSGNSLQADEQLNNDEYLESTNGRYRLYLQGDGNVVLRDWDTKDALWSTGTNGQGAVRLRFQGDGNLVLRSSSGSALWSSNTSESGATRLVLNNGGSLVIYAGDAAVWAVNDSGDTGGNDTGGNDGDASSTGQFSSPSAALYSLNDSRQRAFPKHIDTNFNGNGHSETWDGRVFVIKRKGGWWAAAFRPERIGQNNDGTPILNQGAFGSTVILEREEDATDMLHNWIAVVPDPGVSGDNPYPSNSSGSYRLDGAYSTYKSLIYHTSTRNGDNDQMGVRRATFIVSNANTRNAQVARADFTSDFARLRTQAGADFRCIEPSVTIDGRLIVCQGHPDNNGRIDNLMYGWNQTSGATTGWSTPKSIANMYYDDRNKDVSGVPFSVRFPIAEKPLLDATGNDFGRNELVKGAYPWISHDGSELFYQSSRENMSARRTGTTVVGRWTGWTFRHIDGPINRNRYSTSKLFLSSPGAFTTMWSPYKDVENLAIPYSVSGPSYPMFGSNTNDYMEVSFDDYLDGNYLMYLGMNEQINREGDYQVNDTNDTSGNFNNASLVGAKFPIEYNGNDELVGRYGQGIYFRSNTYLQVDRNRGWNSLQDGVTVDFYIRKLQSGSGKVQLFDMQNGVEVYLSNATTLTARIEDQSGKSVQLSGSGIGTNQWVHVAFSYNPLDQKMILLVNGNQVASRIADGFGTLRTSGRVRIGPDSSDGLMILDEFKISNVARSRYEIAHNANVRINKSANNELANIIPSHLSSLRKHATDVNRFSMVAAALGEDLFSDVILSKQRTTSCATCHELGRAFTDGRAVAQGDEPTDAGTRNTPTLVNRLFSSFQGWSGLAATLDTQALIPVAASHEMNLPISEAVQRLRSEGNYTNRFESVFGELPDAKNFPLALASFQATQFSPKSRFDQFKEGDLSMLSDEERRGLGLFEGKARCSGCHAGRNFTDESFRNNGLTSNNDIGRADATGRDRDHKLFKVPTLRGLGMTGPFMHDGSIATLRKVVEDYNEGAPNIASKDTDIRPLELTSQEVGDLLEFLSVL